MKKTKVISDASEDSREQALHYMQTLVDVARESFLILDADLRVISANPTFYQVFKVLPKQTENTFLYRLGNGQWNIPELRSLFEEILPKKKNIRNYEVNHNFEKIGGKTMLLNARQIDSVKLIILAIEDITERKGLEKKLADYSKGIETTVVKRTKELVSRMEELERVNKIMVGREMKMIELKAELAKLKGRLKLK